MIFNDAAVVIEMFDHFIVFLEQEENSIKLKHMIGIDHDPSEEEMVDLVEEFLDKTGMEYDEIDQTRLMVVDQFAMKTLYEHFLLGNKVTIQ